MKKLVGPIVAAALFAALAVPGFAVSSNGEQTSTGGTISLPPECSLAKTNKSCTLIIDRSKPLSPPTVQMYSGETLTVIVKNANTFERYLCLSKTRY